MLVQINDRCTIFFGDASNCLVSHMEQEVFKKFYQQFRQQYGLGHLVFQHQVHGADGQYIHDANTLSDVVMTREHEGDFLITNQNNVGIGVITADCLPIVFYAPDAHVIAVAHAGWRGTVAGITGKVLQEFVKHHDLDLAKVQVYFGPSAGSCCYEVQSDFLKNLESHKAEHGSVIIQRQGKYFFNNVLMNKQLLIAHGIKPENINDQYNLCTLCNHQFHSFRRSVDKITFKVEATIVWLKKEA